MKVPIEKSNLERRFTYKFSIIDWIGIVLGFIFINFVFWGCLFTGYYIVSGVVALWLFLLFHKRRWVRLFKDECMEVFHIRKWREEVDYNNITRIAYEESPFLSGQVQIFYCKAGKENTRVQFEHSNSKYLAEVLNYIKDKVPANIIDEKSLLQLNLIFENGIYKFKSGVARNHNKGKL
ncbi:MAG: hypothetical protein LC109_09530 [Bacteroidia bacterium]|nr:hypothetical protein [Bacteroidia bacterium]